MKKIIFALIFFLSVISISSAQTRVSMTFDYTDPLTGITFEVQKKLSTEADTAYRNVTVTSPVTTTSETVGVPRYLVVDQSPEVGTWVYRVAAIKNSIKSTYAVSNEGTVPPITVTVPPSDVQINITQ